MSERRDHRSPAPAPAPGTRQHLTLVFDEGEVGEVAEVRRRWDPVMARRVPPHVTLVYPEEFDDRELLLQRARAGGTNVGPFSLATDGVVAAEAGAGGVFLAVSDPSGSWRALRDSLLAPPFRPREVPPHLTIVHPRTSARGPEAWAELAAWRPEALLVVRELAFTETSVDTGLVVVERVPLRASQRALCVGLVLVDGPSVLLSKRSPGRRWHPGVWDLPGGHVEPGESLRGAAAREAREELGVDISPSSLRHIDTIVGDDYQLVVLAVSSWTGAVSNAAPHEHEQIAWFTAEHISRLDLVDPRLADLARRALRPAVVDPEPIADDRGHGEDVHWSRR